MENRKAKNKNGGKAGTSGVPIKAAQGDTGLQPWNIPEELYRSKSIQGMDGLHEFGLVQDIHFDIAEKVLVGRQCFQKGVEFLSSKWKQKHLITISLIG